MSCHDEVGIVIHRSKWRWEEISRNTGFLFCFSPIFQIILFIFLQELYPLLFIPYEPLGGHWMSLRFNKRIQNIPPLHLWPIKHRSCKHQSHFYWLIAHQHCDHHHTGQEGCSHQSFPGGDDSQMGMNSLWRCSFCVLTLQGWWGLTRKPCICMVLAPVL